MRPLKICIALFSLLYYTLSWAGDAASLNFIGFSEQGKYLAFQQYGITAGQGAAFSEFFIVDVPNNRYSIRPIITEKMDADTTTAARKENLTEAEARIEEYQIIEGNYGDHVIARAFSDVGAMPKKARFSVDAPLAGISNKTYSVILKEKQGNAECYNLADSKMFTLILLNEQTNESRVLQDDKSVPNSRACPLNYRIQDVYVYNKKNIAVFLNMYQLGFEGINMRYLVVTGTLN